ncbi:histidinol-phosphatase [Treponema sp. OttesenSCG-928-L16]|nr:histidinol-phosphatase [Treponema sp. OttesenSCG-928-L16]
MRYSSLHIHSNFCDGSDSIEVICGSAYEKGLESLGFSSHAPLPKDSGLESSWHMRCGRLDEYIDAVLEARERWQGKMRIYLGLEVDYIRDIIGPSDSLYRRKEFDYIIGAVHYIIPPDGSSPFTVDGPPEELYRDRDLHFNGNGEALAEAYWDAVEEMLGAGGFDILAHFDLIKKNNSRDILFQSRGTRYLNRSAAAADKAARHKGFVLEVNTGGLNRGKTSDPYPSSLLLKRFSEQGIPVSISADAHHASHILGHYEDARELLLQSGYTSQLIFGGRKDGVPVWEPDPL